MLCGEKKRLRGGTLGHAQDDGCRIARRQLYLERFEDCRAIARNLPEAHAARKVVRGMRWGQEAS
jgi:hypothetical protein